jgi:uncharacterized SAM-dependent methyltransferase
MQYYRNIDISRRYNVSLTTVRKWIDAARAGRIELKLYHQDSRWYIANTARNQLIMEELARQGRKFRKTSLRKTVQPTEGFYKLYSRQQILDIIASIEKYREVPLQYAYFDGGADNWDEYVHKLLNQGVPNTLTGTVELLKLAQDAIANFTNQHKYINVIDLGVGNAMPVCGLLNSLLTQGRLQRYVAIDNSPSILEMAERNIKEWFDGQVGFEGHVRDILTDRFDDLVAADSFDGSDTVNLVLLLGGTLSNLRDPDHTLQLIHRSMGPKDLLLFTRKLDTPQARTYFDIHPDRGDIAKLPPLFKMLPDLLNIDESFYDVDETFDPDTRSRYTRIQLEVTLSIVFKFSSQERTVTIDQGEELLLWRARHQNTFDVISQFDQNNFELLHANKTRNNEYILLLYEARNDTSR